MLCLLLWLSLCYIRYLSSSPGYCGLFFLTVMVYPCDERNNQLKANITEAGLHDVTQRQYKIYTDS